MKSHDYLIIGCGRFGSRAIETLLRKDHRAAIIVVDKDEKALEKVSSFHVERIEGDGISFLNQSLKKGGIPISFRLSPSTSPSNSFSLT